MTMNNFVKNNNLLITNNINIPTTFITVSPSTINPDFNGPARPWSGIGTTSNKLQTPFAANYTYSTTQLRTANFTALVSGILYLSYAAPDNDYYTPMLSFKKNGVTGLTSWATAQINIPGTNAFTDLSRSIRGISVITGDVVGWWTIGDVGAGPYVKERLQAWIEL